MANASAPWLDDPVVGAAPSTAPAATPTADTPWASDPVVGQAPVPKPVTQDDINDRLQKMLADPKISGKAIRDFYTGYGSQIPEYVSKIIDQRDQYIAANHDAPTIGLDIEHPIGNAGGLVDNRPFSFYEGVRQGDQQVLSNVAGGLGWVGNKIGLDNNWADGSRDYFRNLEAPEKTQGSNAGKITGEIAATLPLAALTPEIEGVGIAGTLGRLGVAAGDGAVQGALTTNSRTPGGVAQDAAVGAGLGAGFGSAFRGLRDLAGTPTRAAQQGREVLDAADRLSRDGLTVAPLPGDAGGALARGASAVSDAGIVSNVPYSRGVDGYLAATQAVRDRAAHGLSDGAGVRSIDHVAGDVQNSVGGLGDYEARSAEAIGNQYDNAARLAAGVQIATPRTRQALDTLIAQREAIPGDVSGLDPLRALRDDLTPTPDRTIRPSLWDRIVNGARTQTIAGDPAQYAIDSLRRLRTSFGDNFDSSQRSAREAANLIWPHLSQDIQDGLRNAGRADAADAYSAADRAWAERATNLDEVVRPILGNRNQGQLADHLINLSRNDPDGLSRALGIMRPDMAAQVRGALVGNLGRAKSGAQNAAGDAFSLQSFLTDWDKVHPTLKTSMLSGQEGQDLQDLARLAQAARDAGRYRNTSGTARAADALGLLKSLGSTLSGPGGGFAVGGIPGAAAGLAGQYGLGRAMASPTLARGLVRAGEIRPISRTSQALAKLAQLTGPVIANGVPDDE
jgi:hypothetical protein